MTNLVDFCRFYRFVCIHFEQLVIAMHSSSVAIAKMKLESVNVKLATKGRIVPPVHWAMPAIQIVGNAVSKAQI